ncbi:hypothetical protein [Rouxiella chamberiensis]|uniref:Uncharacterized protein n=1 Tax=Rouxiella chamberiensis TaxID=1513468 RepID=A0ABY7HRX0_9GAMM|nr:hypothetical protein [Rouxiella chamberiensis]WAT02115.1 hypothetical protein O1V66_05470 [Rouxiella chamberiensis]
MNRNDDEKLSDIMMGKAVLALLHGGGPVSTAALITQLQALADEEKSEARKRACERAINEVRNSATASRNRTTFKVRGSDNVGHIFSSEGPSDDKKKH